MRALLCIILCELVGVFGAIFTGTSIGTWYAALRKPSFSPPGWIFAPAWTTLYALMGIAVFLIWRMGYDAPGVRMALIVFAVQLILNALWSPAFFGLRSPVAGLCVIIPLWVAIVWTIAVFYPLSKPAALLLVPYIMWVSFATVLNAALVYLNR